GMSNVRMLSIISFKINNEIYWYNADPYPETGFGFHRYFDCNWIVNWRADIGARKNVMNSTIKFEVSKVSYGEIKHTGLANGPDETLPWSDSSNVVDSSISLTGEIDLLHGEIVFGMAFMKTTQQYF